MIFFRFWFTEQSRKRGTPDVLLVFPCKQSVGDTRFAFLCEQVRLQQPIYKRKMLKNRQLYWNLPICAISFIMF